MATIYPFDLPTFSQEANRRTRESPGSTGTIIIDFRSKRFQIPWTSSTAKGIALRLSKEIKLTIIYVDEERVQR